jgi:type I restriction enzyme M protein
MAKQSVNVEKVKSMESWIWAAACSIRGAADAPKYKDYILPLIFMKRLCDVYDDEIARITERVKSKLTALQLVERDNDLVRFYLPIKPNNPETESTWSVIRTLSDKIGEGLTDILREVAKANKSLQGILDRIDYNATTHGQRDLDDARLSKLIEKISEKRLGIKDVEPDIIGRCYEYLIKKFAENSGQSAGEFYTPTEVGVLLARLVNPESGMEVYDPTCGSGGLLIKCELVLDEKMYLQESDKYSPLKLYGQEFTPATWAMSKMNMVIHDMEGKIELGDTMNYPKFTHGKGLKKFDLVVANPMWNQTGFNEELYTNDTFERFEFGYPGGKADWGWMQHINSSLKDNGRAAIILGIGSATRGSNATTNNVERNVRRDFINADLLEAVILLPFNLFYNTDSPGVVYMLNKNKDESRKGKILFINASEELDKGKPKNLLTKLGADRVVDVYKNFNEVEGFSRILTVDDLTAEDYVFNPARYVLKIRPIKISNIDNSKSLLEANLKNLDKLNQELISDFAAIQKSNPNLVETIFGKISDKVKLQPLSKFIKQFTERGGETEYPVLSCSKVHGIVRQDEKFKNVIASANQSNYKVIEPNMFAYDPMLLWDGSIGRNYYSYSGIVSPAYTVFEVDETKIDLDYLDFILKHEIMLPFYVSISDGTNMRRRKAKFSDFKKLLIPVLDNEKQELIGKTIKFSRGINQLLSHSDYVLKDYLNDNLVGSNHN